MNATRRKATPSAEPTIAGAREIVAGTSKGYYVPTWQPLRPNADQHEHIPSRIGKRLNYRDGREEKLA